MDVGSLVPVQIPDDDDRRQRYLFKAMNTLMAYNGVKRDGTHDWCKQKGWTPAIDAPYALCFSYEESQESALLPEIARQVAGDLTGDFRTTRQPRRTTQQPIAKYRECPYRDEPKIYLCFGWDTGESLWNPRHLDLWCQRPLPAPKPKRQPRPMMQRGPPPAVAPTWQEVHDVLESFHYPGFVRQGSRGQLYSISFQGMDYDRKEPDHEVAQRLFELIPEPYTHFVWIDRYLSTDDAGGTCIRLEARPHGCIDQAAKKAELLARRRSR